jgi:predicted O-methyltransferase YrrM
MRSGLELRVKKLLRLLVGRHVVWANVQAYKQTRLRLGAVRLEPRTYVAARGEDAAFEAVRRGLAAAAKKPSGRLARLAEYRPTSELLIETDLYGNKAPVPIKASEDFAVLTGGTTAHEAYRFDHALFLHFLVRELRPKTVLELGTGHGQSGLHILEALEANGRGHFHTVELDPTRRALALSAFERYFPGTSRVTSVESSVADALPALAAELAPIDLVYEDGPHTAEVTLDTFERAIDHVRAGGLYIVDDINFRDQELAWAAIRNDERIGASLEINARFGLCVRI